MEFGSSILEGILKGVKGHLDEKRKRREKARTTQEEIDLEGKKSDADFQRKLKQRETLQPILDQAEEKSNMKLLKRQDEAQARSEARIKTLLGDRLKENPELLSETLLHMKGIKLPVSRKIYDLTSQGKFEEAAAEAAKTANTDDDAHVKWALDLHMKLHPEKWFKTKDALIRAIGGGSGDVETYDLSGASGGGSGKGKALKPPSGYQWTPDGSLEPITGGPADKPGTEAKGIDAEIKALEGLRDSLPAKVKGKVPGILYGENEADVPNPKIKEVEDRLLELAKEKVDSFSKRGSGSAEPRKDSPSTSKPAGKKKRFKVGDFLKGTAR